MRSRCPTQRTSWLSRLGLLAVIPLAIVSQGRAQALTLPASIDFDSETIGLPPNEDSPIIRGTARVLVQAQANGITSQPLEIIMEFAVLGSVEYFLTPTFTTDVLSIEATVSLNAVGPEETTSWVFARQDGTGDRVPRSISSRRAISSR
jgi:virulence-associated protein VagC